MDKSKILTVSALVDQFLTTIKSHSAHNTYRFYEIYLREFVVAVQPMRVCDLTSSIVHAWIDKRYGRCSDSTRHAGARCVCRVINWAIDENPIDRSPLKRFRKPAPGRRESFITGEQYAAALRALKGRPAAQSRKDVVMFLWHTGCRPQEFRIIEARWIDGRKIVFPQDRSKGKRKRRVIYLDGPAEVICAFAVVPNSR